MTSIKAKFHPSKSEEGSGKIYYQVIHERVSRQWCSDYLIFSKEWDERRSVLIITPTSERRSYLSSVRERMKWDVERLRRIVDEFSSKRLTFTSDDVMEEFAIRQYQQSFFRFMESVIAKLRELGHQRTSETYIAAINSFRRFMKNEELLFDFFDTDLMESYEAYLTQRGLIPNSISFHMRILRAVYNRAVERGITDDRRPFRHVYTGVDKTAKRALNVRTIKKINEADLSELPAADFARDMFMLSFFLRGMSFVDMAYLRKTDLRNGQVTYRRRKTGQRLTVRWRPEMQRILDKYGKNKTEYLLPLITSDEATPYCQYRSKQFLINKGLKVVAKRIGLKMSLSLYCSRHSWASIAKAKGIPIGVISDGLGHDSELTTQIYLSTLDTSAVDRANALIIELL